MATAQPQWITRVTAPRGWLDGTAGRQVGGQVNGYAPRYSGSWGQRPLWRPDPVFTCWLGLESARLGRFMLWLISAVGVPVDGYTLTAPSWTVTYEQLCPL
jgi:hypothetical protein